MVLPTVHPADALKSPRLFAQLAADLRYAVKLAAGGVVKSYGETTYAIVQSADEADEWVGRLQHGATLCAADIETTGLNPRTDAILCIGIAYAPNRVVVIPGRFIDRLKPAFADPRIRWAWHNGKFDTAFLQAAGLPARVDEDSMLMHYALDEQTGGHGLKQLATTMLGAPEYKDEVEQYAKVGKTVDFSRVPTGILYDYLAKDCDYTYQLAHLLTRKLQRFPDLHTLYREILIPASIFLQRVERNGIAVDRERIPPLRADLEERARAAAVTLDAVAAEYFDADAYQRATGAVKRPDGFNPASPKQLLWLLYDHFQLRPAKPHKMDTKEATLKTLDHPMIAALLAYRKATKQITTYCDGIEHAIEADGRVHTTYLIHGTVTGRLSSNSPNVQNIPQDKAIRGLFVAAPGHALIEADFAAHELRCLANLSGDPNLSAVLNEGRDLHSEVCTAIFAITEADVDAATWKRQRTIAKSVTFGIMYGRTAHGLAKGIGVDLREGQEMILGWARRFPEAWRFLQACRAKAVQGQPVASATGRRRRFPLITNENREGVQREASNFPIQSLSSDLTLLAAMAMERAITELGGRIVNLVHDSVMLEVPDDPGTIDRACRVVLETMRATPYSVLPITVPFEAEVSVGYRWGETTEYVPEEEERAA